MKDNSQKVIDLTKTELSKLKVFCDYLFYDQTKYYASYPRFIESCGFILDQLKDIKPFQLFKNLCGFNCKYLSVSRLMKRYQEYKAKRSEVPFNIKKFFSFLFNSCLKSNHDQYVGRELNELTYSNDFDTDRRISKVYLYKDEEDILQGFTIEYNDNFDYDLYDKYSNKDKYVCLNLSLKYLKEIKAFDGITHCFGTITDKLEYIGFKCRSGTMKSYGIPKGEAFLFGEYGKEINGFKIQINSKGINFFQPSLNDCGLSNQFIDKIGKTDIKEIKIYEEQLFNDETPIDDSLLISPIVKDYNESNIQYDFFSPFQGLNSLNKIENSQSNLLSKEDYYLIKERKKKEKNDNASNKDSNGYIDRWEKQTIKSQSVKSFLLNANNYNSIIDKLRFEIEREIEEEMVKYDYDKQFDFYDEYLMKYNILQPFPFNPKHFENYKDIKCIQLDFSTYNRGIEDDEIEADNELFEIRNPSNSFTEMQTVSYWKRIFRKMKQRSTIVLFKSIMCLIKSIKIIQTIEDQYIDDSIPLEKKIIYYKELIKSKRLIYYLSSINQTPFNYLIINKKDKQHIYNVKEENSPDLNTNSNISDFEVINRKLTQIEYIIKNKASKENYKTLNFLYLKYSKIRLDIIIKMNIEEIAKNLKLLEEQYNCNSIRESISKEKAIVNCIETILFTTGDIKTTSLNSMRLSNVPIYKKQSICKTKEFKDLLFTSNMKSNGNSSIEKWSNIKWEKIDMILYSTDFEVYSLNKIDRYIQCGIAINNAFQIALIALMKNPYLIKSLFPFWQKSNNGQYGVYLRIKGIWKLVFIDELFPCLLNKQNITCFAFSSLKKSNQIWVQLIEKALAKINGSYNNLLKCTVKNILDVLTNSITEKINISFDFRNIILQRLKEEISTSIVVIKAISSISLCNDVGLLPGYYYIVEEIKDINIGGMPETLIKLSNSFGCLKYKGNWSKNSTKWIPSIINEKPSSDNEFYICLDDFLKYFSVLYINRLYHRTEHDKANYTFVHYSKNESMSPKITRLSLSKPTKLSLQFHQHNSKHEVNNSLVPGFVMISDGRFKYINSISETNYSMNMNLELDIGEYYIYSDIFSRYLMKSIHGYTISIYSQNETKLIKETKVQAKEIINRAIISYMKENITSLKEDFNMNIYQLNKLSSQFPFILHLYCNEGPFEQRIQLNVNKSNDKVKNYAFYSCGEYVNDNHSQLNYNLNASKLLLVMILRFNNENTINLQYSIDPSLPFAEKEDYIIQNGEKEHLDEDNIVIQYVLRCKDGCYVLLKNNSEEEGFKMKLSLKGLVCENYPKGDVFFIIKQSSSELFRLKELENNNSGINSFMFQLA